MKTASVYKNRLDKLITSLKGVDAAYFDMSSFLVQAEYVSTKHCGTAGCIAGHAAMLATRSKPTQKFEIVEPRVIKKGTEVWHKASTSYAASKTFMTAMDWLGLDYGEAEELFLPNQFMRVNLYYIKKGHAVKALRVLRRKGTFTVDDWKPILGMEAK